MERGVDRRDIHSYGSRRGNHEVMMRGTFARECSPLEQTIGRSWAKNDSYIPSGEELSVFDAAMAMSSRLLLFSLDFHSERC